MANPEHLEIIHHGVEVWNQWREGNTDLEPDLSQADLSRANLAGYDLSDSNLRYTFLRMANLNEASLKGANLRGAEFLRANLKYADLGNSYMVISIVRDSDLSEANLRGAYLHGARFNRAVLSMANFADAKLQETVFVDTDLSNAVGLEDCNHQGPSVIDYSSLFRSKNLPQRFLRDIGLPDHFIDYVTTTASQEAAQYYSCFISYSSTNKDFARRLHADLQDSGVRCWFAPEDMRIGSKIRRAIDSAIRLRDKLLVILSETSVNSEWVETEVETALTEEQRRNDIVLFPIRIDDAVMDSDTVWARQLKETRHIGDFTGWKDQESYQKAFERLLRDLKASE